MDMEDHPQLPATPVDFIVHFNFHHAYAWRVFETIQS